MKNVDKINIQLLNFYEFIKMPGVLIINIV